MESTEDNHPKVRSLLKSSVETLEHRSRKQAVLRVLKEDLTVFI